MEVELETGFNVGSWRVEPQGNALCRGDQTRRIGHTVMAVLLCLARRAGRVCSKEELVTEVWEGAFTSDDALSTAVYELRKALDDDARDPRYIETIRKSGYRLIAPVEPLAPRPEAAMNGSPARPLPARRSLRQRGGTPAALALLAVLLVGAGWAWGRAGGTPPAEDRTAAAAPVSTLAAPAATAGRPAIRSLAVLPMTTFNDECRQDFFADGLAEILIADLALMSPLEVSPGILVRGEERWDLERAAAELAVDAVVEGSVLRSGDQLWISVQLVDTATGRMLWGGIYERSLGDTLLIQKELAEQIALEIRSQVGI